jgi:putative endonuclease
MGQLGENLGAAWLQEKGFMILHRNWRHSYYEIDIIATRNHVLHFIEVKMRSTCKWGLPEDSVDRRKFRKLLEAADQFLHVHPQYQHVQYDVLAISRYPNMEIAYFLIEDIYFDPAP